jgi:hypothetical protein
MRPEPSPATKTAAPLVLRFEDLFDHVGTPDLRYGAAARELSGRDVVIEGYLSHAHGARLSLVDQQGVCPDCSPVPAAAIALPGARAPMRAGDEGPVRVRGRLDYGFRIDEGVASMLRIERAAVRPVAGET